ncbi:MAG: hypothetical protein IJZ79_02400 [Bacilli bacterium]|nr:hypothetical protein [Bacilli bacterium]
MLYCIIGPSGCGKSTVVNELIKRGHKAPDSYTTRPPRFHNEGGHTYISEEEYEALEDKVAYTTYNGYRYCVTKQMLNDCDLYIVDPAGIETLKNNGYDNFKVIGLDLEPSDCASRMLARGDFGPNILGRLEHDWYMFRNFEQLCDFLIDATQDTAQIVAQIEEYMMQNS